MNRSVAFVVLQKILRKQYDVLRITEHVSDYPIKIV